jgi:hypothetical protein
VRLYLILILFIAVTVGSNLGSNAFDLFLQDYPIDFYEVAETDQEKENKEQEKKFFEPTLTGTSDSFLPVKKLSYSETAQLFDYSSYQGQIDLPPELV